MNIVMILTVSVLLMVSLGGVVFAFAGATSDKSRKRLAAVARPSATARVAKSGSDANQQRRKNVQTMLKELEKQQAEQKTRPSLRRRIEQAGLTITVKTYWIASGVAGLLAGAGAFVATHALYALPLAGFAFTFGVPRWVLSFLKARREKAFTREFAPAIDTIVRSVKSGLPVNEALKLVASEIPEPVGGEFRTLTEGLKVGVTMEDGLKRMYERMPTAEVNFFGIVMTIQQKSGGNLSEALSNLSGVLRDRKRLQGKIRAMSSEAKSGAMIIGSLPPGVAVMIYISTPSYILPMFTTQMGNLMLLGCAVLMGIGVLVMKKMVSFKY
jgi:tight adherence protein B